MNKVTQTLYDQFAQMKELSNSAIADIDKQVAWLTSMRQAFVTLPSLLEKGIADLENNTVVLSDPDETMASLETAVDARLDPAAAGAAQSDSIYRIESGIPLPPKPEPVWQVIARLMRGKGWFKAADAGRAYEAETGRSLGVNRSQTVRNNLLRKDKVFTQNTESGLWIVNESNKEVTAA